MNLAQRPGCNLLRLLTERQLDLTEFAVSVELAASPRHALANLRRYTHAAAPKWPTPGMVERWASALNVDPAVFYGDCRKST